mgnify:CR=1 FL=1
MSLSGGRHYIIIIYFLLYGAKDVWDHTGVSAAETLCRLKTIESLLSNYFYTLIVVSCISAMSARDMWNDHGKMKHVSKKLYFFIIKRKKIGNFRALRIFQSGAFLRWSNWPKLNQVYLIQFFHLIELKYMLGIF